MAVVCHERAIVSSSQRSGPDFGRQHSPTTIIKPRWRIGPSMVRRKYNGCRKEECATIVKSSRLDEPDDSEVPLQQLMSDLDRAIDDEEYELAASLRDKIQMKRRDNRIAVEEANERFYNAFRDGNVAAMSQIWGSGEHVQCIHPAAECIAGRDDVMASWKIILSSGRMNIRLEDVRIYTTDTEGYVTLVEVVDTEDSQGRIVATNIFERQQGSWKIVHHHGGPVASRRM